MTKKSRWLLGVPAVVFLLLIVWIGATIYSGYRRAPPLVAAHIPGGEILHPDHFPPERLAILLRVEDPRFFEHHGVDLRTPGSGFTTITQGLVKSLYFDSFKPGPAKVTQTLYAIGLDCRIDKKTQLALFLNTAYLGSDEGREVRGFPDASRAYFGKEPLALSDEEYLELVAIIIGPNQFHPVRAAARNRDRVERIERLLAGKCAPRGFRDVYYEACR